MMWSLAKWVARGLLVLVALAVVALGVIYAGSEWILRRRHAAPVDTALPPAPPAVPPTPPETPLLREGSGIESKLTKPDPSR